VTARHAECTGKRTRNSARGGGCCALFECELEPMSDERSLPLPDRLESASLRLILESLPTGTIIIDQLGRIVMLNRRVEEWTGYERQEILGQPVECLVPDRFKASHPGHRMNYLSSPRVRPMGGNLELFARRKDGSEYPVDISLHPLPLLDGMHVMVHMADATLRHQAEARQRHQESLRRMQFMVENLPAGAIYVSLDTQKLMVNRAFTNMTGYSQDELEDLATAYDLLFQGRSEEFLKQHEDDHRTGFRVPRTLMIHRKDGRQAWVEFATYRYNDHEVWLMHDLTEWMAAQERLVQSTRLAAIGEMMTGLAHESRNALQRARAAIDMLELDLDQRPNLRMLSQRAISAIDELQRLYEEVRNYAAPIQLEKRDVDLEEAWSEAWGQVSQVHREKKIRLNSYCDADARMAQIDRHRLNQVFRNILENAVAVLPEYGGVIDVTSQQVTEEGVSWIQVTVEDNGPGMTEEQKARIYEPFYTTKTRGTGLGMAIVRRIMEAHGGSTSVGSPERGSQIVLHFPLATALKK
jgi:PAS domain S-box-containing protein